MSKKSKTSKSTATLDPRLPKIGAIQQHTYRNTVYTWQVTDKSGAVHMSGGKLKRGGEDFASVSSAANHLTTLAKAGGRVSGFVFFGLGAKEGGKMAKAEAKAAGKPAKKAKAAKAKAKKPTKAKAKAKGAKPAKAKKSKPKAAKKSSTASKANSIDVSHTSSNPAAVVSEE